MNLNMSGNNRILITGASGLLGSVLTSELSNNELLTPEISSFDITDQKSVYEYFRINDPDIIVHTAAHTNVEEAEDRPDIAWKVNALGTLNICRCILNKKKKLVFISSTGVYGNEKTTPWLDYDVAKPTTVHHRTKLYAENIVRTHIPDHLILRTGWLFGGSINNPKNFVYKRYTEAYGKEVIYANPKQFGNPTSVSDLSKQIALLIENDITGTFNCVNSGAVSRLQYIKDIVTFFGLPARVEEVKSVFERKAKVSDNEMALNYFLDLNGLNLMPDYRESLKKYIKSLKIDADKK